MKYGSAYITFFKFKNFLILPFMR